MIRLLREPLVWFLLIGAGLFALNAWRGDASAQASPDAIVVTQGRIENLAAVFAKVRGRRPTPVEMRGLVRDFVLEEALVREGIKIGIDQDDTIIRRRIRQKMEFVVDELLELTKPSESDLEEWLATPAADYAKLGSCTFRHVYFNADHSKTAKKDARAALARLKAGGGETDAGDPLLMVEPAFKDEPLREVVRALGQVFAAKLLELPIGEWTGPVRSGFGLHLVFVEKRTEGKVAKLEDVREAVARDWSAARRREMREGFYEELRKKYVITVEQE